MLGQALHLKFKDESTGERNIHGIDVFNEIRALQLHFPENQSIDTLTLLQYLFTNDNISISKHSDGVKNITYIVSFSCTW